MSTKNREGKNEARRRLDEEAARERTRRRTVRRTAVRLSAVALATTAVAVGIAFLTGQGHPYDAATDAPAGTVGADRLDIRLGMPAPATLTVHEDPRCAACGRFEREFRTTVEQLERQGRLQVDYRIVSAIDRRSGGHGSREAAQALACAQNSGRFIGLHDLLFAEQPAQSDDAFASAQRLTALAGQVPGLDPAAFGDCLAHGTYAAWVDAVEADGERSPDGTTGLTVLLNGVPAYPSYRGTPTTPAALTVWVDRIDGARP